MIFSLSGRDWSGWTRQIETGREDGVGGAKVPKQVNGKEESERVRVRVRVAGSGVVGSKVIGKSRPGKARWVDLDLFELSDTEQAREICLSFILNRLWEGEVRQKLGS